MGQKGGTKRPLGIPTVLDRVIQQAIAQVLDPLDKKVEALGLPFARYADDCSGLLRIRSCRFARNLVVTRSKTRVLEVMAEVREYVEGNQPDVCKISNCGFQFSFLSSIPAATSGMLQASPKANVKIPLKQAKIMRVSSIQFHYRSLRGCAESSVAALLGVVISRLVGSFRSSCCFNVNTGTLTFSDCDYNN